MSDMVKRWEESKQPRPAEAKKIPELAVNFVDVNNDFAVGFTTQQKRGDPTSFTTKAINHYDTERKEMTVGDSFQPVELGAEFNQWGPNKKYYQPGRGRNNN